MRMSTLHIIRKIISKLLCGCRGSLNTEFSFFICNSVSLSGDYSRTGKGTPVNRALLGNLWLTCSSHSRPYVLRKSHFRMGFRASWRVTSVQSRSCVWLCDPMDCSTPGFPVRYQLPELVQTTVLRVDDAIQPSLLSPSPPALKVPSIRVFSSESALRIRWPKDWSFSFSIILLMNTQDWSPLGWTGWISLQSKGLSRVFSNTTAQKHQFFSAQLSVPSNSHIHTWPLESHLPKSDFRVLTFLAFLLTLNSWKWIRQIQRFIQTSHSFHSWKNDCPVEEKTLSLSKEAWGCLTSSSLFFLNFLPFDSASQWQVSAY